MEKEKKTGFSGDLGDPNNPINISERGETKFCSNCGAKIDVRAEICPKCGVRVAPAKPGVPQGGTRILLYIISFLIAIVGIIIGVIYLTKPSEDEKDFGAECLMIGLISSVLGIFFTLIPYSLPCFP